MCAMDKNHHYYFYDDVIWLRSSKIYYNGYHTMNALSAAEKWIDDADDLFRCAHV